MHIDDLYQAWIITCNKIRPRVGWGATYVRREPPLSKVALKRSGTQLLYRLMLGGAERHPTNFNYKCLTGLDITAMCR